MPFSSEEMALGFLPLVWWNVGSKSRHVPWRSCSTSKASNNEAVSKPSRQTSTLNGTVEKKISSPSTSDVKMDKPRISSPRRRTLKEAETISKFDKQLQKNKNGVAAAQTTRERKTIQQANKFNPDFCTVRPIWPALKRVLIIHCGGTFGMDAGTSFDSQGQILPGTGGTYSRALRPGTLLGDILDHVPELRSLADLDVQVAMNMDSARVGPREWIRIAKLLHRRRQEFDAFVVIHGTDTLSYTGAALSLMLAGFGRPVVLTGSQLPMMRARSDARQNLIDSVTCATDGVLQEFAVCFGGTLIRANRAQKISSTAYRAFESPTHPDLAKLGVNIEWDHAALWKDPGVYRPRFKLETNVIRIPVVPGVNPRTAYGDLYARGVRGAVLESFGVGNMPDQRGAGWLDWLKEQRKEGLEVYLASQCLTGPLHPELYRSGQAAMAFGAQATRRMTAETAVVKLMLCLAHQDLHPSYPLAGEL